MTGYVTTRWYRAPEIILSWMKYDSKGTTYLKVMKFNDLVHFASGYVVSWLYNGRASYWTSFV